MSFKKIDNFTLKNVSSFNVDDYKDYKDFKEIKKIFSITKERIINYNDEDYFFPQSTTDLVKYNGNKMCGSYMCLECNAHLAENSHSVSNGQIKQIKINKEKIYGFRNDFFSILTRIINKINVNQNEIYLIEDFSIEDFNFFSITTGKASTFPGFCSSNGKNCDHELFKNLDGNKEVNIKSLKKDKYLNLKKEIMYRTIAWKIFNLKQKNIFYENILKLIEKEKTFEVFFQKVILDSFEKKNSIDEYFKNQNNVLNNNIVKFEKFIKEIKADNSNFYIKIIKIENPKYIGINYFNGSSNKKIEKFFDKYDNLICCFAGVLAYEKNYYNFIIVNNKHKKFFYNISDNKLKSFVKTCLFKLDNENTFVSDSLKGEASKYIMQDITLLS